MESFRDFLWIFRGTVSTLLDHGHPHARRYPLGLANDESRLIHRRVNGYHATQAIAVQGAIGSVMSKEGAREFKKTIEMLLGD